MKKEVTPKEVAKLMNWPYRETKQKIDFDQKEYFPLLSDKEFFKILLKSMERISHTLNIYKKTPSNDRYNEILRKRSAWIKEALKDPLLRESDKEFIQQIDKRNRKRKSSQLWAELAENLIQAFTYIVEKKYLNKTKARYFLLEALCKWFPDNAEVRTDKTNDFEMQEKLKKHLK